MNAMTVSEVSKRERLLVCFALMQLLDLATTLAVFSRGGSELNPIIRSLVPVTGPVLAVVVSKAFLIWLAWRFTQRTGILYVGIALYAAIVTWNFGLYLVAA